MKGQQLIETDYSVQARVETIFVPLWINVLEIAVIKWQ